MNRHLHLVLIPLAICIAAPVIVGLESAQGSSAPTAAPDGAVLYTTSCSTCHGDDARGTDRGPSLLGEGAAAVDWVLRTGRMPLPAPDQQAVPRSPEPLDRDQIDAIIGHLRSLGMRGPEIPTVSPQDGDVARGGAQFRLRCAACHQVLGQGGVVNAGRDAPPLQTVDATTVGEVLAVGPGVMPSFADLDSHQVDDIAAYVLDEAQHPDDAGGLGIGHIGPVAEGFAAAVALVVIVLALRWIGTRTRS